MHNIIFELNMTMYIFKMRYKCNKITDYFVLQVRESSDILENKVTALYYVPGIVLL